MDGLILDTEPTYYRAWQKAASDLGMELNDEFFASLSGYSHDKVEKELLTRFGETFPLSRFQDLSTQHWWRYVKKHGIKTKPGYAILLKKLHSKNIPFILATNSQQKIAEECLHLAGIREDFETLITRDKVKNGKPAPDLYLYAANILNLPSRDCLAVEDSEPGIQSALSAGTIPIMIPENLVAAQQRPHLDFLVLPSLTVLADLV